MLLADSIVFNGLKIEHVVNPGMKHSYIIIGKEEHIILKTPRISRREALRIIENRLDWIHRKLDEQRRRDDYSYEQGREVRYLGELHPVKDNDRFDDLHEALGRLRKRTDDTIMRCYDTFYKKRSVEYLSERLAHFEKLTGLEASGLRFRKMRSRWGSCSAKGEITFNVRIMQLPVELIDYVIVHELAHLRHMNHSKAFYGLVGKHMPNYKVLQKSLRNIRTS